MLPATTFTILAWYGSNIGVLLLNKYLLSSYGFKYPFFLTLCHMIACASLSLFLAITRLVKVTPIKSRQHFAKITLLAIIFCVTVVLGNISLRYIPVSFNQAIGATTPVFTAAIAAIMLGQKETKEVYLALVPVVIGIMIASGAEPMFQLAGFTAAITATAARAFKSVLQGLMLSDSSDKMDSLSLLMYMAPIAGALLLPATMYFEPNAMATAWTLGANGQFWGLLILNSFLAYFVNLTNFVVTRHTSALTLQVLGNAKSFVAVGLSVALFKNPVNILTVLGYAITVAGVALYSRAKMGTFSPLGRTAILLPSFSRHRSQSSTSLIDLGNAKIAAAAAAAAINNNNNNSSIHERSNSGELEDGMPLLKAVRPADRIGGVVVGGKGQYSAKGIGGLVRQGSGKLGKALSGVFQPLTRGFSNVYGEAG